MFKTYSRDYARGLADGRSDAELDLANSAVLVVALGTRHDGIRRAPGSGFAQGSPFGGGMMGSQLPGTERGDPA